MSSVCSFHSFVSSFSFHLSFLVSSVSFFFFFSFSPSLDQSSKDCEELRSLRTTVQQLRQELRDARSSCLSQEEVKELKKENEELKTQVEEKKKEKEKIEDLAKSLEEMKLSLKKKEVECQDAQNTAQLKGRMVVAQEEQIDKMKKQLQAKEETLADLASRLKRKERDADKKLQEYAER